MPYYLIETEDVGPNKRDSGGLLKGDTRVMTIQNFPGTTNMSHEERIDGWLGTTNDIQAYACGEFDTIEEAREEANRRGFTEQREPDDCYPLDDDGEVEYWISEAAARDQVEADSWFLNNMSRQAVIADMDISAETTDEELGEMAVDEEENARNEDYELHGALDFLRELREYAAKMQEGEGEQK